jgi:hypothetical protein
MELLQSYSSSHDSEDSEAEYLSEHKSETSEGSEDEYLPEDDEDSDTDNVTPHSIKRVRVNISSE